MLILEIALGIVLGVVLLIVGYLLLVFIAYAFTEHKWVAWGSVAVMLVLLIDKCSPSRR